MKILVMGAAGMIGRKLIERLLSVGTLRGEKIAAIHGFDVVEGTFNQETDIDVTVSAGDISDAATVDALVAIAAGGCGLRGSGSSLELPDLPPPRRL